MAKKSQPIDLISCDVVRSITKSAFERSSSNHVPRRDPSRDSMSRCHASEHARELRLDQFETKYQSENFRAAFGLSFTPLSCVLTSSPVLYNGIMVPCRIFTFSIVLLKRAPFYAIGTLRAIRLYLFQRISLSITGVQPLRLDFQLSGIGSVSPLACRLVFAHATLPVVATPLHGPANIDPVDDLAEPDGDTRRERVRDKDVS